MRECIIEGCSKPFVARGYCGAHYMEARRKDPRFSLARPRGSLEERFFRKIERTGDCWIWVGNRRPNGYGIIQQGGKGSSTLSAHRLSYEMHKGLIPDGLVVMHSCDNPACVNPDHLTVGTYKQNTADMIAKGRKRTVAPKGTGNGKAKLNDELVRYIRTSQKNAASIARELKLSENCIRGVRSGRTWSHVQ
jgi:hypothetical protein